MRRPVATLVLALASLVDVTTTPTAVRAQDLSQAAILERLQRLESEQGELRRQLEAKDKRLNELETELRQIKQATQKQPVAEKPATVAKPAAPAAKPATAAVAAPATKPAEAPVVAVAPAPVPAAPPQVAEGAIEKPAEGAAPHEESAVLTGWVEPGQTKEPTPGYYGMYTPGRGFTLARTEWGEVTFSAYTYVRYLNQKGLDDTYVNGLGQTVKIDKRDDVQLNKAILYFKGWLADPKFRYLLYAWTNNTSQGLPAQVVIGGSLTYEFDEAFILGAGIAGLPTVRSNEGSWPYFLGVDHRTIADEFFRGSYTTGLIASGEPLLGLRYILMVGNNLSQLGVDAGQLDGNFDTVSGALWWMPTTGEFGERGAYGDYDEHQDLATRIGAHFTFSPEDKQSQPNSEDPDNTQIRLSNGTTIFTEGALAPGVQVNDVHYYMTSFDAGLKYQGFSLEGEYYLRWLNDLKATGALPKSQLFDHGFQAMTSMMLMPKTLQLYLQGSMVFGEYGDPWELIAGVNWYPFHRREVRFNLEYLYDSKSPVGYFAIPQTIGGTGSIVNANLELYF